MNKKIFWLLVIAIIIVGSFLFYKNGFWYDIGYYFGWNGYNMSRVYCDWPSCM